MTFARQMILAHPGGLDIDTDALSRCIDECLSCAQACIACADGCIAQDSVTDLRRRIYLCVSCADICETTARIVSWTAEFDRELARATLEACATSCNVCGHHGEMGMAHCEVCAKACRRCEEACRALIALL